MNNEFSRHHASLRARPLTIGLSAALATGSLVSAPVLAKDWQVLNCQDNGAPASLRILAGDPTVQSGDTFDLSALPLACGTKDSVISLQLGAISVHDDVTFKGPDPATGSVTITATAGDRVIVHGVGGTLTVRNLTIANGHSGYRGGCVASAGKVELFQSVVRDCSLSGGGTKDYLGGAIYAAGNIRLTRSTVSGSTITKAADAFFARGGGVYAKGDITASYTTVHDNHVATAVSGRGQGGGLYTPAGSLSLDHSTIDHNSATGQGGGISVSLAPVAHYLFENTISNNTGLKGGGINLTGYGSLEVARNTIAFNHATYSQAGFGGVAGCYGCSVTLTSSIVANNTDGDFSQPSDLYTDPGKLQGSDNLILSTNVFALPAGFITVAADPKLGPLHFNGGVTQTHALLAGSPAIGTGKSFAGYVNDQRGIGYPRVTGFGPGATVDIGAYEYDEIFVDGLDGF